jgi:hypothetical protein
MKGIRHVLRDFTASAVKEHLRSQIEDTGGPPDLTENEIELVRFIRTTQLAEHGLLRPLEGSSHSDERG